MRRSLLGPAGPAAHAQQSALTWAGALIRAAGLAAAVTLSTVAAGPPAIAARTGMSRATATGKPDPAVVRAAARPAAATAARRPVLLINGDRVIVTAYPGHARVATVLPPASGGRASGGQRAVAMTSFTAGGHSYMIPDAAQPYLGRGLDLSLFDLAALRRAETHGRLPVRITYRRHLPALPGLHITSPGTPGRAPARAAGYLTAASTRLFGTMLTRQQPTLHGHAATGGLFPAGVSISLAGAAPPAAAHSARSLHTLTVTGTGLAGKPSNNGSVLVSNVDNSTLFVDERGFRDGTATFDVPAGHYWAVGNFLEGNTHGFTQDRVVVLSQFTVTGNTSVHVTERAASSKITMVTPRPAVAEDSDFEVRRPSPSGPVQFDAFSDAGFPIWVSPERHRVTVGKLQTFSAQQLVSPADTARTPYEYTLAYRGPDGIIPGQRHVVHASGLATVNARYFQDIATTGGETRFGMFRPQLPDLQFESINFFPMPRHQTEYLTGNPAISWFDNVSQCYPSTPCPGGQNDAVRTFRAGERTSENWNAYPLHPAPNVNLDGAANPSPTLPSASRAGNTLTLDLAPFGDNQPGHTGAGFTAASYQLDQNGKKIAAGSVHGGPPDLGLRAPLTAKPATITFSLSASRAGTAFPLSSQTNTVWTWNSAPAAHARLPRGWTCAAKFTGSPPRRCAVQPLLTLRYTVAGLALDGSAPPGPQTLGITAGHLPLAHAAPVAGAQAWVSFDNGKHWQPAYLARHSTDRFAATYTAPAGAGVTLRVQATDKAGGTITETIHHAYRTSG